MQLSGLTFTTFQSTIKRIDKTIKIKSFKVIDILTY